MVNNKDNRVFIGPGAFNKCLCVRYEAMNLRGALISS